MSQFTKLARNCHDLFATLSSVCNAGLQWLAQTAKKFATDRLGCATDGPRAGRLGRFSEAPALFAMESATNIKQVIGFSEHASPARTDGKIIAAKPPGVLIRLPLFASGPRDFSSAASCRHASCSAKSSFCFGSSSCGAACWASKSFRIAAVREQFGWFPAARNQIRLGSGSIWKTDPLPKTGPAPGCDVRRQARPCRARDARADDLAKHAGYSISVTHPRSFLFVRTASYYSGRGQWFPRYIP
jgi:hypothetical protein